MNVEKPQAENQSVGGQSRAECANLTAVLAVTADELRTICDTTVRLTEIRQQSQDGRTHCAYSLLRGHQ